MLFILPLGHQVTQEEVLICPSHAAVLANYSDLMCTLAGICGDARCYCINPPAPSVVFIILNRLPSLVGAAFLCTGNLPALAQDVTQHGQLVWLLVCVRVCGRMHLQSSTWRFHPSPTCPLLTASFAAKPTEPHWGSTAASWCNLSVST